MGIADDIKKLGEEIVTSYDIRVKAIGTLVKDTHRMLKGFQAEHKEMATKLDVDLEKGETDRLKAFKPMMANIQKEIKAIETYVKSKLKEFSDAHADMSEELKKELAKYVDDMVKATKKLMGDIQTRQKERNAQVADLLESFKTEREKMAANWQALTAAMAKKRGAEPVKVEAAAEVKTVEEAVKGRTYHPPAPLYHAAEVKTVEEAVKEPKRKGKVKAKEAGKRVRKDKILIPLLQ